MDRPRGYYSKGNKSGREKQILYNFTYMWNVKNNIKQMIDTETDSDVNTDNRLMVARGERCGGHG